MSKIERDIKQDKMKIKEDNVEKEKDIEIKKDKEKKTFWTKTKEVFSKREIRNRTIIAGTSFVVIGAIAIGLVFSVGGAASSDYTLDMFMPNTPVVMDGSFNQGTFNGVAQYSGTYNEEVNILYPSANASGLYGNSSMETAMTTAFNNGTQNIISAGYSVATAMGVVAPEFPKDNTILLDDATLGAIPNAIEFYYQAQSAGFLAGVAAATYAEAEYMTTGDYPRVSTYGGTMFNTVYDYMSGYEQGINWFNYAILGYALPDGITPSPASGFTPESNLSDLNNSVSNGNYKASLDLSNGGTNSNYAPVQLIDGKGIEGSTWIDYSGPVTENPNNWYSGNFNAGGGTAITTSQYTAGSLVYFPVAGPQTLDTMNVILNNKATNQKVIGVDTDASLEYTQPSQENLILGSATKNLQQSAFLGLWYTDRWMNDLNGANIYATQSDASNAPVETINGQTIPNYYVGETIEPLSPGTTLYTTVTPTDYQSYLELSTQVGQTTTNELTGQTVNGWALETGNITTTEYPQVQSTSNNNSKFRYGTLFRGGGQNGGVTFANQENGFGTLNTAISTVGIKESGTTNATWTELVYTAQLMNPVIQAFSTTFQTGATPILQTYNSNPTYETFPWIPDWSTYTQYS